MRLQTEPNPDIDSTALRAKSGDSDAMLRLWEQFSPLRTAWVRRAAARLPRANRDELASEVSCAFLELTNAFEPGRGLPFAAYLTSMLTHRMRNFIRREYERRSHCLFDETLLEVASAQEASRNAYTGFPSGRRDAEEIVARVWWEAETQRLTGPQQRVMEMVLQGYSEREIGFALRISCVAVHKCKRAAQKKLQQTWRNG